jgi:O-antigen ligase
MILLILLILSTVFSVHVQTSIWSSVLVVNYFVIFYLVIHTIRTRSHFRQLVYLIVGMATVISLIGLLKWSGANLFPWWHYTDIRPQPIPRLTATFGNANHMAGYMAMAIPMLLGLFLTGLIGAKRLLLFCLAFLFLCAFMLTLSRGGLFAFFAGLTFMAFGLMANRYVNKKYVMWILLGGFLCLIFVVLSSTSLVERIGAVEQVSESLDLSGRVRIWTNLFAMIKDFPLLGAGPGTFAFSFTPYHPPFGAHFFYAHNDYLHVIAEVGLPLAVVVAWMIIAFYRKGFKKLKNQSRLVRGITLGAMSGVFAILIHSIVDFNLHIPANAVLFTILAALVVAPLPVDNFSKS